MDQDLRALMHAWLLWAATNDEDSQWADDTLMDLTHNEPEVAWLLLLQLAEEAPPPDLLTLGVGPIQSLVIHHGERFASRIVEMGGTSAKFREALRAVRTHGKQEWELAIDRLNRGA